MPEFFSLHKPTAVNLIVGSLGSGKTTLLRKLLLSKPKDEHWLVLVNEFGAIGIDGTIFSKSDKINVKQIPGGCICCTAQNELTAAIQEIINTNPPDRLLIEPTGLGEPATLVDLLHSDLFQNRFDIQTTFGVLDCSQSNPTEIQQYIIMQNLINMADVLILNKSDLASTKAVTELQSYCNDIYPAKTAVITTTQADIDSSFINLKHSYNRKQAIDPSTDTELTLNPGNAKKPKILLTDSNLPGLVKRQTQQHINTLSIGWIFNSQIEFDWAKVTELLNQLNNSNQPYKALRAKAILKAGKPWILFQWANQQTTRETIAYRRDSRFEILLSDFESFNIQTFEKQLQDCQKSPTQIQ